MNWLAQAHTVSETGAQPVSSVYIFYLKDFSPRCEYGALSAPETGDEGVLSLWRLLSSYKKSEAGEWTQFMQCFLDKHKDQASTLGPMKS